MEYFTNLFGSDLFIPHGHCYLWKTELVGLHLISDLTIAIAYFSIPLTLFHFVEKREDLPFNWIFNLFGAFIILCGTTHLLEVWTLWHPVYWLSGTVKAGTAMVSAYTSIVLVKLIPQALLLPSPAQLATTNQALEQQIRDRELVEAQLQQVNDELEAQVTARTLKLAETTALLEVRNQELDRFAYTVSHDLKAPLRGVANLSDWIEDSISEKIDPETQKYLDLMRSRVARMRDLIDGLLDFARVGQTEVSLETFVLEDLLVEIIDSLNIPPSFKFDLPANLSPITTNRLLLSQVFANLIGNAYKHHDRNDGHIQITAQLQEDLWKFTVTDDGPGILAADRERVFDIFQTLVARDRQENTGIGLSIVKKLVNSHGGDITIESELGLGTTFRFTWSQKEQTIANKNES
ncbi:ATP-binding protein [Chamaesiphon sp.]|uniref:sensor histidine kinase n=1 Tax=Chamaesiphon sp. TaxID=2814140 RepID=UPI003593B70B